MGKLVDIDDVRNAIKEEWDIYNSKYTTDQIIDDTIRAVEQVKPVEAISMEWIENWIKKLESVDNTITKRDAMAIKSMLTKWKMEQYGNCCNEDCCEIGGNHG